MKKIIAFILLSSLSLSLSAIEVNFTILHTNDLHSYFDGVMKQEAGKKQIRGKYARLAHMVKSTRRDLLKSGEDSVLLVDAGDFYSGTLFHSIAPRAEFAEFPEYEFFRELNYDAITLGNHEFDAKDLGFHTMMGKTQNKDNFVPIVSTNFNTPKELKNIIMPSLLKELKDHNGQTLLKVGFLGALGPNGCKVSKGMREKLNFQGFDDKKNKEKWDDILSVLSKEAKRLKSSGADVIVLMLHGGGEEDEKIAKKIPLINVIIAGHTHEVYHKMQGDTVISQAGYYGQYLGVLPFHWDGSTLKLRKEIADPSLTITIDESIPEDIKVDAQIGEYQKIIDRLLREESLPKSNQVVYHSKKSLPKDFVFGSKLGKFITSKVKEALNEKDDSIDLYFTTLGLIRTGLLSDTDYTTSEVFKIMPLGFGKDYQLGTPTVSFYLNKGEIKKLIEFLNIYSSLDKKFMPAFSDSLTIELRKWGIPFINKIKTLKLNDKDYDQWPELIHVATNAFVFKYISFVNEKSLGIVKLIPKDKDGNKLKDVYVYKGEFPELLTGLLKDGQ